MLKYTFLVLTLVLSVFTATTRAQIYYQATTVNGTQILGAQHLTVTPNGTAGYDFQCLGPYRPGIFGSGSFTYSFSIPVTQIRMHIQSINQDDTIGVKFNGIPYNITSANLSFNAVPCQLDGFGVIAYNGIMTGNVNANSYVQFDANPGFNINSVEVSSNFGSGVDYDFYFTFPCATVLNISHDSACIGQAMHLYSNNTDFSNNAFFTWTGPNGFTSGQANPAIPYLTTTSSGMYKIIVHDTGCVYKDSFMVATHNAATTLSSNTPICVGASLNLSSTNPGSNTIYRWTGPNNFISSQQNPVIVNSSTLAAGKYFLTDSIAGCTHTDSTTVVVNPLPYIPSLSTNSPVCSGSTLMLYAAAGSGVSYSWSGPGGFNSNLQNPQIINAQTANSGTYTAYVTLNGCMDSNSTTVIINQTLATPTASISSSAGNNICSDSTTTFSVATTNTINPDFQWKKNGLNISAANTAAYTPTVVSDGDIFSCYISSHATCQLTNTALSNFIVMHTTINNIPTISISMVPPNFVEGSLVTFTTYVSNSTGLSYQWQRNGIDIPGAVTSSYSTDTLHTGDLISVFVTSSVPCTIPNTASSNYISLDVNSLVTNAANVSLYPNPNNGFFTIRGTAHTISVIEIFNTLGQLVARRELLPHNNEINENIELGKVPNGLYLLHISGNNLQQDIPFIVNK